jgi:hypothetical protein
MSVEIVVGVAVSCQERKRKNQTGFEVRLKYDFEGGCDDKVAKE